METWYDVNNLSEEELQFLSHRPQYYDMLINPDEVDKFAHLKYPHLPKDEDDSEIPHNFSSRGYLDCLRNEFIYLIFKHLDIASLFTLRMTCHNLRDLVNCWPALHKVFALRGKIVLKALLAVQTAKYWSLQEVRDVLEGGYCAFCGSYGDILHLLILTRCCFRCLCTNRRALVVSESYAERCMGVPLCELSYSECLKPIQQNSFWGNESPLSTNFERLYDYQAVAEHAMRIHAIMDYKYSIPITDYRSGTGICPSTLPKEESIFSSRLTDLTAAAYFQSGFEGCPPVLEKETVGDVDPAFLCTLSPAQARRKYERIPLYVRRSCNKFRYLAQNAPELELQSGKWKVKKLQLPSFLLNPPHSSNLQHAACIYSPPQSIFEVPLRDNNNVLYQGVKRSATIHMRQCTGCSFFWNFHSGLPSQAQNKYACSTNIVDDLDVDYSVDLKWHLQNCYFARMYWNKLWMTSVAAVPIQQAPVLALAEAADIEHILSSRTRRSQRHFSRHMGYHQRVDRYLFERVPWYNSFLADDMAAQEHTSSHDQQSQLQLELQNLYQKRETSENEDRSKVDVWTGEVWEGYRWDKVEDRALQILTSFTEETLTQASWATAHPNSGSYIFGAWKRVVQERMRVFQDRESGEEAQLPEDEQSAMAWFGWF